MDIDGDEEEQKEEAEERVTTKRRRVSEQGEGAELVASWDLSKGVRRLPSLYVTAGRQMSVLQAMERRSMGFKAGSAQGAFASGSVPRERS